MLQPQRRRADQQSLAIYRGLQLAITLWLRGQAPLVLRSPPHRRPPPRSMDQASSSPFFLFDIPIRVSRKTMSLVAGLDIEKALLRQRTFPFRGFGALRLRTVRKEPSPCFAGCSRI